MLYAKVGKRVHIIETYEQASRAYRSTIERLGLGASQTPRCRICDHTGHVVAHVSYNGRVWAGDVGTWKPGDSPLYDPR